MMRMRWLAATAAIVGLFLGMAFPRVALMSHGTVQPDMRAIRISLWP